MDEVTAQMYRLTRQVEAAKQLLREFDAGRIALEKGKLLEQVLEDRLAAIEDRKPKITMRQAVENAVEAFESMDDAEIDDFIQGADGQGLFREDMFSTPEPCNIRALSALPRYEPEIEHGMLTYSSSS